MSTVAFPPARPNLAADRLTPRQERYQADPAGCLETLQRRADHLFGDGYVATPVAMPLVFVVRHEARGSDPRDAAACYHVHALKRTCSCPFFTRQRVEPLTQDGSIVPCKHLLGLENLVRRSVAHFKKVNDLYQYLRLLSQWMTVLAEQYRSGVSLYTPAFVSAASSITGVTEAAEVTELAPVTPVTTAVALPEEVQKGNESCIQTIQKHLQAL